MNSHGWWIDRFLLFALGSVVFAGLAFRTYVRGYTYPKGGGDRRSRKEHPIPFWCEVAGYSIGAVGLVVVASIILARAWWPR